MSHGQSSNPPPGRNVRQQPMPYLYSQPAGSAESSSGLSGTGGVAALSLNPHGQSTGSLIQSPSSRSAQIKLAELRLAAKKEYDVSCHQFAVEDRLVEPCKSLFKNIKFWSEEDWLTRVGGLIYSAKEPLIWAEGLLGDEISLHRRREVVEAFDNFALTIFEDPGMPSPMSWNEVNSHIREALHTFLVKKFPFMNFGALAWKTMALGKLRWREWALANVNKATGPTDDNRSTSSKGSASKRMKPYDAAEWMAIRDKIDAKAKGDDAKVEQQIRIIKGIRDRFQTGPLNFVQLGLVPAAPPLDIYAEDENATPEGEDFFVDPWTTYAIQRESPQWQAMVAAAMSTMVVSAIPAPPPEGLVFSSTTTLSATPGDLSGQHSVDHEYPSQPSHPAPGHGSGANYGHPAQVHEPLIPGTSRRSLGSASR